MMTKKSNYPESMSNEVQYLRQVRDNLNEYIVTLESRINDLQYSNTMLTQLNEEHEHADTWYWHGDGYDHLDSIANNTLVIITAHELRNLLKNGEFIDD